MAHILPSGKAVTDRAACDPAQFRAIGPWRLTRQVGAGAWTEVYQALPAAGATTAAADYLLKTLKAEFAHDRMAIGLLQREAFVLQQVRHPHVATVLSQQLERPPYYLVGPFLPGISAETAWRERGRLAPALAVWIARQIAEALAAVHAAGWLHGDIKPANMLVQPNGHATLIDFGLARRLDEAARPGTTLAGTPNYLAPEALRERPVLSAAADVYSLGASLFELLTGRLPFAGEAPEEWVDLVLHARPPLPRSLAPELPSRLNDLIGRMLAKEPLRRPTADELIGPLVECEVECFEDRWVV